MKKKSEWDPWALAAWFAVLVVLALVLVGVAMHPEPEMEPPTAKERAAQFAAQARYYEVLDIYGDMEGAVEAARLVYEELKQG